MFSWLFVRMLFLTFNAFLTFAIALGLAFKSSTLVLLGRSVERTKAEAAKLAKESGNDSIVVEECDLASIKSVVGCCERLVKQYPEIDVLVNNAASVPTTRTETKDGVEVQPSPTPSSSFLVASD